MHLFAVSLGVADLSAAPMPTQAPWECTHVPAIPNCSEVCDSKVRVSQLWEMLFKPRSALLGMGTFEEQLVSAIAAPPCPQGWVLLL